jgi:hypothetical protein
MTSALLAQSIEDKRRFHVSPASLQLSICELSPQFGRLSGFMQRAFERLPEASSKAEPFGCHLVAQQPWSGSQLNDNDHAEHAKHRRVQPMDDPGT